MTFHVGQKVVCVSCGCSYSQYPWPSHIVVGGVYVVRDVDARLGANLLFLRLEEYVAPTFHCDIIGGSWEVAFYSEHFRPAVEKTTDISIFTKLLSPSLPDRVMAPALNEHESILNQT